MNNIVNVENAKEVIQKTAYLVFNEDAKYAGMLMATEDELVEIATNKQNFTFIKM